MPPSARPGLAMEFAGCRAYFCPDVIAGDGEQAASKELLQQWEALGGSRVDEPNDATLHFSDDNNNDDDDFYDWKGFAPAGRLDRDSTGLMVFTKNGVLAKKIIGASSSVEKEYIVDVAPAVCPTKRELAIDPNFILPSLSSRPCALPSFSP